MSSLKKTNKRKFGIFLLSCVLMISVSCIMLIASEFFVRWYYQDILSSAAGANYFHLKSWPKFAKERNALRLRGKHFDIFNNRTLRVAVLGDSLAYGQGVYPYDKRFPEMAYTIFKEKYPDHDIEIVNLGICGHNLMEHNRYIKNFVLAIKPDFVLYQWYPNDMSSSSDFGIFIPPPLIPNKKWHKKLNEESILYFLVQRIWKNIRIKTGLQRDYSDYLVEKFRKPENKHAIEARNQLNKLLDQLKVANIAHGIVLFPSFATPMKDYKLGFLHDIVLDTCQDRKINCLDLRETYSKYDNNIKELWANTFDPHPSKLAHKLAAEEIINSYENKWVDMATSYPKNPK